MADDKLCPIHNEPIIFVQERGEFWCYLCDDDPFRESRIHDDECAVFKFCMTCRSVLKWIPEKKDFWCWTCNKYPLLNYARPRAGPLGPDDDPYKRTDRICFTCGRYLRFIKSKRKHWCDSCRNYPILYYKLEALPYYHSLFDDDDDDFGLKISTDEEHDLFPLHKDDDDDDEMEMTRMNYRVSGDSIYPRSGGPAHYRIRGNRVVSTTHAPEGPGRTSFRLSGNRLYSTRGKRADMEVDPSFEIR
ncbi:MAG: hypothetical protein ACMUHM_00015 [Thermoplasmatota archaeon]